MRKATATLLAILCLSASAHGQVFPMRSPDGQRLVYAVPRGSPRTLMTEVWTARPDGGGARRLRTYLGEPGDVAFLPGGEGALYMERSLSYALFGSHLCDGHFLPFLRNRVWRLKMDGSEETPWPLPDALQPLRMAVSPDGERLALSGYRGEAHNQSETGLWTVDRRGVGARLLSGRVSGPLRWSSDSERVFCIVDKQGRSTPVAVHTGTGEVVEELRNAAPSPSLPVNGEGAYLPPVYGGIRGGAEIRNPKSEIQSEAALALISSALDLSTRAYHAMHQGDPRAGKRDCEAALRDFEALLKGHSGSGISKASCLGYIQALQMRTDLTDAEREQVVCQDHLLVIGDLLSRYSQGHGQRLPADVENLRSWVAREVEGRTPDAAIRARDLTVLAHLFHCPADPDPARAISYTYRPEAFGETSALTCFWHRGRLFHLAGTPGRYCVENLSFSPDQVDSLDAVATRRSGDGEASRAVSLLEVVAHQRPTDAVAHNRLGYAALKSNAHARAEEAFKRAASLVRGRERARAYCGLGLIHMERSKGLYTAIGYFRDALTQDRGCVDARFLMAKARYLLWEYDAKADVETVLRMDPNYADAYLLMGDWYADLKEDYGQAIPWYAKYIAMRPDDPEGRRRMSAAYLKAKDYDRVLETLLTFVQEHRDAVEVMPIAAQACVKQEKLDMASSFYRAYISRLNLEDRALYEDVSLIASKEEVADYARTSGAEREVFLRRFWSGRDPDLSTPVNERLLEHYRRVWYARQTFSKGRQPWDRRGEVYVRFGEPDHRTSSLMMNASQGLAVQRVKERTALDLYGNKGIGETYVGSVFPVRSIAAREGRREHDALVTGGGVEVARQQETQMSSSVRSTQEEYVTKREQRGKDTQSQLRSNSEEARLRFGDMVGSADLSRVDALRGEFGERGEGFLQFGEYRPVLASDADVSRVAWESWVYSRIGGGIEITFTDESGKGVYDYAPVPTSTEVSTDQLAKFVRYAPRRVVERAIAVSPDFYAPDYGVAAFDFYFDLADFRGRDGRSALEVYYGIPQAAARYVAAEDVTRLAVERQVALISATSDTVYRAAGDLVYQAPGNRGGRGAFVPDVVRLEAPSGTYRLEVRARDRMTGRLGLYRKEVMVEAYGGEGLRVSDLELAWRISEGGPADKFSKGELHVIPMPTRGYRKGQNVFVYYEVYNLARDESGQTQYQVEYTIRPKEGGIISRLVRTFVGKKEEVAVGYEGRGFRETEKAHMELNIGDCGPGQYYLKVSVTDLNSGETATKEIHFAVAE